MCHGPAVTENQRAERSRIAVVATPRSGNTWLRGLLAQVTDSVEIAEHTPEDFPWDQLPERVVLQIHWYPTEQFRRQLDDAGFKVVTIARHPLDVLMSVLHFCRHEVQTDRWLDGAWGGERALVGAAPQDQVVRDYAASRRFRELLGVTGAWWQLADAVVRYEDLVAAPEETLLRLAGELQVTGDLESRVPVAVESRRIEAMRPTAGNQHYWQGLPGGWRRLLPEGVALQIAVSLADVLAARGYGVDPRPGLSSDEAARNWAAVEVRTPHAVPAPRSEAIAPPFPAPRPPVVTTVRRVANALRRGRLKSADASSAVGV